MTRLSDITGHWFGLCRKPPVFHTLRADTGNLHEPALAGLPEGSGAGHGLQYQCPERLSRAVLEFLGIDAG